MIKELLELVVKDPERFPLSDGKIQGGGVYWHIRRLVVAHEDAQDATQETFVRGIPSLSDFKGECTFRSWVYRIATNEALLPFGKYKRRTGIIDDHSANYNLIRLDEYVDYSDLETVKLQKSHFVLACQATAGF